MRSARPGLGAAVDVKESGLNRPRLHPLGKVESRPSSPEMTAAVRRPCCLQAEGGSAPPLLAVEAWCSSFPGDKPCFQKPRGQLPQRPGFLTRAPTPGLGKACPSLAHKSSFLCSVLGPSTLCPVARGLGKLREASPPGQSLRDQKGGSGDAAGRYRDCGKED